MKHLVRLPLTLLALLVFTSAAMTHLPAILEPVFALAGGDADILAGLFGLAVVGLLAAAWVWSDRSRTG